MSLDPLDDPAPATRDPDRTLDSRSLHEPETERETGDARTSPGPLIWVGLLMLLLGVARGGELILQIGGSTDLDRLLQSALVPTSLPAYLGLEFVRNIAVTAAAIGVIADKAWARPIYALNVAVSVPFLPLSLMWIPNLFLPAAIVGYLYRPQRGQPSRSESPV